MKFKLGDRVKVKATDTDLDGKTVSIETTGIIVEIIPGLLHPISILEDDEDEILPCKEEELTLISDTRFLN